MNSVDVQCVRIEADAASVFAFLADPSNLPKWAVGFASQVEIDDDGSVIVTTGQGHRMPVVIVASEGSGVVDFVMTPAPGMSAVAWARVVTTSDGAMVTFAQAQSPGVPDEVFAGQVAAVTHELGVLKAVVEVSCPR
ncbi:MAG: SRPBCC family protein [Vicinamibacterales bacterium]